MISSFSLTLFRMMFLALFHFYLSAHDVQDSITLFSFVQPPVIIFIIFLMFQAFFPMANSFNSRCYHNFWFTPLQLVRILLALSNSWMFSMTFFWYSCHSCSSWKFSLFIDAFTVFFLGISHNSNYIFILTSFW